METKRRKKAAIAAFLRLVFGEWLLLRDPYGPVIMLRAPAVGQIADLNAFSGLRSMYVSAAADIDPYVTDG